MDDGFIIKDRRALLTWWKTMAFEKGISPAEFRRSRISDIEEIMIVNNMVSQKAQRNQKMKDLMGKVRF